MKRQPEEKNSQWMNYVVSLALVMAIAAILITIQGSSPAEAFAALVKGALAALPPSPAASAGAPRC